MSLIMVILSRILPFLKAFLPLVTEDAMLTAVAVPAIISGRNAGIVRAAQRAGFDCSNLKNLTELVEAVRDAAADLSFSNVYGGPPVRKRDHWEPAYEQRARRGVLQIYRDATENPSVPGFVISADDIIRNMDRTHLRSGYSSLSCDTAIQIHPTRKRMIAGNDYRVISSKKLKIEPSISSTADGRMVIDLTEDVPAQYPLSRLHTPHFPPANTKTTVSKKERARMRQEQVQKTITTTALHKIVARLRNTEEAIDKDREFLRKRWEMDTILQLQTVTDSLLELNECFQRAEDGIRDALSIINERLLSL